MKTVRIALFAACLVVFLSSRYIPNSLLKITVGTYPGVVILLGAVLVAARYDKLLSLAVVLASGSLFLENRKRTLMTLRPGKVEIEKVPDGAPVAAIVEGAHDLIEGEEHPDHEVPDVESYKFQPTKDATDEFSPVEDSIDTKQPLDTVTSNKGVAEQLTREGLV